VIEQILQARPEQVNDQDVMETLLAEVINIGNSGCSRLARGLLSDVTECWYAMTCARGSHVIWQRPCNAAECDDA
jgi:predicted MarR family transcription regulator